MNQRNLFEVDWSKIPAPTDDGAAAHLVGMTIPQLGLVATDDTSVTLSQLPGRTIVFAYPRTGEPGKISLVDDWDMIPGARGCTPQTCSFRVLSGVSAGQQRRRRAGVAEEESGLICDAGSCPGCCAAPSARSRASSTRYVLRRSALLIRGPSVRLRSWVPALRSSVKNAAPR